MKRGRDFFSPANSFPGSFLKMNPVIHKAGKKQTEDKVSKTLGRAM